MNIRIKKKNRNQYPGNRSGTTAVEFALVFPIILIFFVAMTVFTQAFLIRDSVQHAAYEGAREGLKLSSTAEDCEKQVMVFLDSMRLKGGKVKVEPAILTAETNEVAVSVSVSFQDNAWIAAGFMPKEWRATHTITLQRYYPDSGN